MVDDERIAALLDGRLAGDERDELLARLQEDDDEYQAFAELAGVLHHIEASHGRHAVLDTGQAPANDAGASAAAGIDPSAAAEAGPSASPRGAANGVIPLEARRPSTAPDRPEPVEQAPGDAPAGVISLESRRRHGSRRSMAYGAMAAGIVGIALTASLLRSGGTRTLDDPSRAVALLHDGEASGLAVGWDAPWGTARAVDTGASREGTAVRLGARLVDLELAAASGDSAVVRLSAGVDTLLVGVRSGSTVAAIYREVARNAGAAPRVVEAQLAQGRKAVRGLFEADPEWLELGVWAETARTAAARHDAAFFATRDSRAALERLGRAPKMQEGTSAALAQVKAALPSNGQADWPLLQQKLTQLLRLAGR